MFEKFLKKSRPNIPDKYEIIYSHRKTLAIQIQSDWRVFIRAPSRCQNIFIEKFVNEKSDWIEKNLQKIQEKNPRKNFSSEEIDEMKKNLQNYITPRTEKLWRQTDFPRYSGIKITKSEHRWWSCSSKNSLNFSYRLAEFLNGREKFIDAVIIHELCHLAEKNHGKNFWQLIKKYCPDYEKIIKIPYEK